MNKELIEQKFYDIMKDGLGLDMNDPSLKDTPKRISKMYVDEIFSGLDSKNEPKVTIFPNEEKYDKIICLKNITLFSTCEHHFVPFSFNISIGYIPDKHIIGISKLARISKYFARRPQIQERLSKQIADYIMKHLKPKGVIVYIDKGEHLCVRMRGIENSTSEMVTSEVRGCFRTNPDLEEKFLRMIK